MLRIIPSILKYPKLVRLYVQDDCDRLLVKNFRSSRATNIEDYKKQLIYRGGRVGQKELEMIINEYLIVNMDNMKYEELVKFEEEVLMSDNMILFNYILGVKDVKGIDKGSYLVAVKEFAKQRKVFTNL